MHVRWYSHGYQNCLFGSKGLSTRLQTRREFRVIFYITKCKTKFTVLSVPNFHHNAVIAESHDSFPHWEMQHAQCQFISVISSFHSSERSLSNRCPKTRVVKLDRLRRITYSNSSEISLERFVQRFAQLGFILIGHWKQDRRISVRICCLFT